MNPSSSSSCLEEKKENVIMAVQSATNVDSTVDTIISRLLEVGLDDTDYWQEQLQKHGVRTVASLKHLQGDTETYSSLLKNTRYKVEKKALAQLLNIVDSEEQTGPNSKESHKQTKQEEEEIALSKASWDDEFQQFHKWSQEKFVPPKKIEERLNHVLKVKHDILSKTSCTSKTWVNEYFTQSALQHFLRTVMNPELMASSQKCCRSIMKEILTREELNEINEDLFANIKELSDWIYHSSEPVAIPQPFLNITDFKALEAFFKKIQEQKSKKESDFVYSNEVLANIVADGITQLRLHYKQEYDDIFIIILIHPYLSHFSEDATTLRPITMADVHKLEKQFSEQRMKFVEHEKWPIHLQSYLLLLAAETLSNVSEDEILAFIRKVGQMMQNLKPPLEQKLSQQLSQSLGLGDLKHILQHNMIVPRTNMPSLTTSLPQKSMSGSSKSVPPIPKKPSSLGKHPPLVKPKPLQPQKQRSNNQEKHVAPKTLANDLQEVNELIKKMGLSDTKKINLQDALCVRPKILELSLKKITVADTTVLPYLVLHKLISYDSDCRSNLLGDMQGQDVNSHLSVSDFGDCGDPDDEEVLTEKARKKGIHPLDSLLVILIFADDFLRQDLFSRLAKCQLAVPLILPDPLSKKLIIPIWALRTIMNDFSSKGQQSKLTHSMVSYPMPILSVIRFGTPQKSGPSKSKLLNDIICSDNHDRYFHRNCPGGHYKSVLVDGLVDMCWFLPTDKTGDLFPDAVTFLNLHGDARHHPHQTKFITQISSMCLVMLHDNNIEFSDSDMKMLQALYLSPGGLTLLNGIGKSQDKLRSAFPKAYWVNLTTKSDSQAKEMIQKRITSILETMKDFQSLDKICEGQHSGLMIDEKSPAYQRGWKHANDLVSMITNYISDKNTNIKEAMLPLQGEKLWKAWALEDKELHRQLMIGSERVNEYTEKIKSRKTAIRNEQLRHVQILTPVMKSFIESLFKLEGEYNHDLRNYFIQCLKLELNSLSRDNVSILQQKYQSTRIELAKLQSEVNPAKKKTSEVESLKKKLEILQEHIIDSSFGLEHLLRELGQVYEAALQSKQQSDYCCHLSKIAAELLIDGYPLELMDGDAAHVPLKWVTAVLKEAVQILDNPNVFVLSVLGLQSTGKSTMLNTAFGLQFNVSAGRCTRGAFMQLLKLDEHMKSQTRCDYVLVVDTEGLRAPELDPLKTQKHDNELATFVIGLANMTLINIFGEVPGDMDDILQTSVHAFLRMHEVKYHPSCQFVHQNAGINIKGEMGRAKFTQKLNKFTIDAAREEHCEGQYESFDNVIKFDDQTDVHYFPGLWKGDPPMAPINPGYSRTAQALKIHLVKIICKRAKKNLRMNSDVKIGDLSLMSFHIKINDMWETLLKEKFVFSFKNTLEITAYNSLETEYSKWDWSFRSAMLEWEQTAENEIKSEALESVNIKVQEKLRELQKVVLEDLYDPVKAEMEAFFNGKQMETLIQWKGRFEQRLSHLTAEVKQHAEDHCKKLLENRRVISEFEIARKRDAEFMKNKVQEFIDEIKKEQQLLQDSLYHRKLNSQQLKKLISMDLFSKEKINIYRRNKIINDEQVMQINRYRDENGRFSELSIKNIFEGQVLEFEMVQKMLKKTHLTEKELLEKFDVIWNDLIKTLPPVEIGYEVQIDREVEKILVNYAASSKGHDGQLIHKIQQRKLQADLEFIPQPRIHFTITNVFAKGKSFLYRKVLGIDDPDQLIAYEITKAVFSEARYNIKKIVKRDTDFKPNFTYELLRLIKESIEKHSQKNPGNFKFTPEYNLEIYIRVCGFAIPKFEEMADSFKRKNHPREYLEKHVKIPLFTKFKNQYKQTETEEAVADTICAYFKTPIRDQVEVKLGINMVHSMKASEQYFSSKQALKVKILKDLFDNNDFNQYVVHLRNVRQSLENHIEEYTIKYCEQKIPKGNLTRLQTAAKDEVHQLIKVIENTVFEINDPDIQTWMKNFCKNENIRKKLGVQLNPKELLSDYDTEHELNLVNFKQKIKEELQELNKMFDDLVCKMTFKSINWKDKPYELLNSLVGCTAQCPFCGEQCDLMAHDDSHDHSTEVHRIDCLAGWRNKRTQVMTTNVCPALVAGDTSFRKPDGEFHPCKDYKDVYKTWSIPPDVTSKSCSYWKWFVGVYNDQLAEVYNAEPADAPHQWSQIEWPEIREDLKAAYNVDIQI